MNSYKIKMLMDLSGENWDRILDDHIKKRKEHLASGGEIFIDPDGEEVWMDAETKAQLEDFNLKHITDPRKMN